MEIKNTEEAVCNVCKEIYLRRKKGYKRTRSAKGIRGSNTKTCSKICAKIWNDNSAKRQCEKRKKEKELNKLRGKK